MKNERDMIPAMPFFDIKGIGPSSRNFDIPKALESTLIMNEINGTASS